MHTAFSLPCWVCLLPFSLGRILCISVCCVLLYRKTAARKKSSLCSCRKEKSPLILICQLQFRIIKACISGRDSVAWQNLQAPCWDQLNSGRLSSMALALGKQKPGLCHGVQKHSSEGGKNLWFKMVLKNETQDTRFIILTFLGNTSKDSLREEWGSSTGTKYWELH